MLRFAKLAAALAVAISPAFSLVATAHAAGGGQIEGGDIYRVKNVTKNSDFVDPASADAGDTLLYKVRIHNPGQECLTNTNVKADLPSGASTSNKSTVTVWADNAFTNNISDTATVNLSSSQSITYVSGSTQLLDPNGNVLSTLPDTLFSSGVNIGTVCISINNRRYVQFQAKISTPPAPVVKFACTALDVKQIDRTHYDFTASASVQNATVSSYKFSTTNSSGTVVDTTTHNTNALSDVYHFNQETGTYTVSAVVNTDHGSTNAADCSKKITVAAATTTTPATTTLPNTGPGEVAGLFAGSSALGAAGHYIVRRRR